LNNNSRKHILTVEVEDYYHVGTFHKSIQRDYWYRFEKRIEQNVNKALSALDLFDIKATFFVLGWVAEKFPELIKDIADKGHEVASKGFYHRIATDLSQSEFREDLSQGREALENACGREIHGYRVAHRWLRPIDLWVLDVLAEEGYKYDSSLGLLYNRFSKEPWRRFAHKHRTADEKIIWEFPPSSFKFARWMFPISGGNYYRQFPHTIIKHAVEHWHRSFKDPFVMYFHIWELDPEQPKINSGSFLSRVRHYRNLDKMTWVLKDYFQKYNFTNIADYLGLETKPATGREERFAAGMILTAGKGDDNKIEASPKIPVTVVVPCFNEAANLKYLSNTLKSVEKKLRENYEPNWVFVDDHSSDNTFEQLTDIFGEYPNCAIIRHERNEGVSGAILTGIRMSESETVCSIDCDCTYDPHSLTEMIPMLVNDVDLVTASPYHQQGDVKNVPGWRLVLSKSASILYKAVLNQTISTYTSCFRVYRKSAVVKLKLHHGGFIGVAELPCLLHLSGSRLAEYPTILEARVLGNSSMKILATIGGHLKLMFFLFGMRIFSSTKKIGYNKSEPNSVLAEDISQTERPLEQD